MGYDQVEHVDNSTEDIQQLGTELAKNTLSTVAFQNASTYIQNKEILDGSLEKKIKDLTGLCDTYTKVSTAHNAAETKNVLERISVQYAALIGSIRNASSQDIETLLTQGTLTLFLVSAQKVPFELPTATRSKVERSLQPRLQNTLASRMLADLLVYKAELDISTLTLHQQKSKVLAKVTTLLIDFAGVLAPVAVKEKEPTLSPLDQLEKKAMLELHDIVKTLEPMTVKSPYLDQKALFKKVYDMFHMRISRGRGEKDVTFSDLIMSAKDTPKPGDVVDTLKKVYDTLVAKKMKSLCIADLLIRDGDFYNTVYGQLFFDRSKPGVWKRENRADPPENHPSDKQVIASLGNKELRADGNYEKMKAQANVIVEKIKQEFGCRVLFTKEDIVKSGPHTSYTFNELDLGNKQEFSAFQKLYNTLQLYKGAITPLLLPKNILLVGGIYTTDKFDTNGDGSADSNVAGGVAFPDSKFKGIALDGSNDSFEATVHHELYHHFDGHAKGVFDPNVDLHDDDGPWQDIDKIFGKVNVTKYGNVNDTEGQAEYAKYLMSNTSRLFYKLRQEEHTSGKRGAIRAKVEYLTGCKLDVGGYLFESAYSPQEYTKKYPGGTLDHTYLQWTDGKRDHAWWNNKITEGIPKGDRKDTLERLSFIDTLRAQQESIMDITWDAGEKTTKKEKKVIFQTILDWCTATTSKGQGLSYLLSQDNHFAHNALRQVYNRLHSTRLLADFVTYAKKKDKNFGNTYCGRVFTGELMLKQY